MRLNIRYARDPRWHAQNEQRLLPVNMLKQKVVQLRHPDKDGEVAFIPMTHGYEPRIAGFRIGREKNVTQGVGVVSIINLHVCIFSGVLD
jgi:hypothetical protein